MKHDDDCPGCQYALRREINLVGVRMTDYKTTCGKCGAEILGEFEHRIEATNYCPQCLLDEETIEFLTVNCGKCEKAIDWNAKLSDVSGGNGYTVRCECGYVQEYSTDVIGHRRIDPATH